MSIGRRIPSAAADGVPVGEHVENVTPIAVWAEHSRVTKRTVKSQPAGRSAAVDDGDASSTANFNVDVEQHSQLPAPDVSGKQRRRFRRRSFRRHVVGVRETELERCRFASTVDDDS